MASPPGDPPATPSWIDRVLGAIDHWASNPTRAWATWIALHALSIIGLALMGPNLYRTLNEIVAWIGDNTDLPITGLTQFWAASLSIFSTTWFIPMLLRLNLARGFLWLLAPTLVVGFINVSRPGIPIRNDLIVEIVLGLAQSLILWGSRRPAYAALVATVVSSGVCRTSIIAPGLPSDFPFLPLIDQAIYAAILLYGTKKIEPQAAESTEWDPSDRVEPLPVPGIHLPEDGLAERTVSAIDVWFQLRWRALLTWIMLSILSAMVLHDFRRVADNVIDAIASGISLLSGTSVGGQLRAMWPLSFRLLALSWFVPIALRLPPVRGLVWLFSIQFFAVIAGLKLSCGLAIAWLAGFILVNFWAIKGRREPASISVAATCALGFLTMMFATVENEMPEVSLWILGNAIYAAVLLYGTKKVERTKLVAPVPDP
ncbi:MAG: hypothetical protein ABI680_15460 [Chthoniobacteraceae bacterium]